MKKALITGITGMVGSHMADFLLENSNWDIYGMHRWRSPLDNIKHLIPRINQKDRLHLKFGDLRDSTSINNLIKEVKPNYVFHLAAQSFPKTSFISPEDTLDTNVQGTFRILEALKEYSPSAIVHICSSSEVFGRVPREKLPISEDCTFHPASPYAISKVGTDLAGRFYAEAYGMMVMTTRMFTHTGPRRGDVFAESTFAKQIAMIENGMQKSVIKVGNLDSLRTFADVRDAARAYHLLLTKNPVSGEYYNIGGQYTTTIGDMLDNLISKTTFGGKITIEVDSERLRPIDADLQIPDTSKFSRHTGWKPEIGFDQTMSDLLEYWRKKIVDEKSHFLLR